MQNTTQGPPPPWWRSAWGIIVGIIVVLVLMAIIAAIAGGSSPPDSPASPTPTSVPSVSDRECLRDLDCAAGRDDWFSSADARCPRHIEDLARYDFEWTDGWLDSKFDRVALQIDRQAIRVIGGKMRMQNQYGAWQRMEYWCILDPLTKEVLDAAVFPYQP